MLELEGVGGVGGVEGSWRELDSGNFGSGLLSSVQYIFLLESSGMMIK